MTISNSELHLVLSLLNIILLMMIIKPFNIKIENSLVSMIVTCVACFATGFGGVILAGMEMGMIK